MPRVKKNADPTQKPKRDRRKRKKREDPPPENMLDQKLRSCLRCMQYFMSTHSGNRRCPKCSENLPRLYRLESRRMSSDINPSHFSECRNNHVSPKCFGNWGLCRRSFSFL